MAESALAFEERNVEAYRLLLRLEVVLRGLIRQSLVAIHGEDDWQKRLPGDLRAKITEARRDAYRPQYGYRNMGPLFYLDFGDLIKLLERTDMAEVLKRFGGKQFCGQLQNLMSTRHSVSHAREVTETAFLALSSTAQQVENALSKNACAAFLQNPDAGLSPEETSSHILRWLRDLAVGVRDRSDKLSASEVLSEARRQYWWKDDTVPWPFEELERLEQVVLKYNGLPAGLGAAAHRERLIREASLTDVIERTSRSLRGVRE